MGIVNSKKKHKVLKPKVASAQSHSSTNITIESTTSFSTNGTRNTKQVQTIQTNTKQTGYQANSINDIPNRYSSAAKISLNEDTIKSSGVSSDISAHSYSIKNNYSDESNSFYLPKDWDRVDTPYNLHFALKRLHGSNVIPSVQPFLKKGARVIFMGTTTGPWIMDMATQYTDCHFYGVEIVTDDAGSLPSLPNVTFIRTDISSKLSDIKDNSIDYVHFRSMGTILTREVYPTVLSEVYRVLRPDGIIRVEELHHSPAGTVMIESFIETLRNIVDAMDQDYDIATKYKDILSENKFQMVECKKRTIHYASDGKISEEFVSSILNSFGDLKQVLAPKMGLDYEDYHHRVEMICAQCVKINAFMDWYSYVARKPATL